MRWTHPSPSGEGPGVGRIGKRGARGKAPPHPTPSPEGEGLALIQDNVILPLKRGGIHLYYWHFAALRPLAIWPFIAADSLAPYTSLSSS